MLLLSALKLGGSDIIITPACLYFVPDLWHFSLCREDPVVLVKTGDSYERSEIEAWLEVKNTCPLTGIELARENSLTPNMFLQRNIQSWLGICMGEDTNLPVSKCFLGYQLHSCLVNIHAQYGRTDSPSAI